MRNNVQLPSNSTPVHLHNSDTPSIKSKSSFSINFPPAPWPSLHLYRLKWKKQATTKNKMSCADITGCFAYSFSAHDYENSRPRKNAKRQAKLDILVGKYTNVVAWIYRRKNERSMQYQIVNAGSCETTLASWCLRTVLVSTIL